MKNKRSWWKRPILVYAAVAVIVATLWGTLGILNVRRFEKSEDAGTYGDSFGMVNSLFSGLAFGCLILALYYQTRELKLQRRELRETRRSMKKSAEAQADNVTLGAASTLLQHYLDLFKISGQEEEEKAFRNALQQSEEHAKGTTKGKIILCTAFVEKQLAKTTGLAVSSESGFDFGLLRAMEWARELRSFSTDIDRQAEAVDKQAPAYDLLNHIHKAARELKDALMFHADWSDSAEKAAPGTRDKLEALLSRVSTFSENTTQTKPPRFITKVELKEAEWAAAECTRIAMEVEKGAGRI